MSNLHSLCAHCLQYKVEIQYQKMNQFIVALTLRVKAILTNYPRWTPTCCAKCDQCQNQMFAIIQEVPTCLHVKCDQCPNQKHAKGTYQDPENETKKQRIMMPQQPILVSQKRISTSKSCCPQQHRRWQKDRFHNPKHFLNS